MGEWWAWWTKSDAGLAVRIAIGAGIFLVLALWDLQRRGKEARRWREYLFLVWPVVIDNPATFEVEIDVLYFFLGEDYLVSIHRSHLALLERVSRETVDDTEIAIEGPDWLLVRILDDSVDVFFPTIDALSDRLDEIEDAMFASPQKQNLEDLFKIKHALLTLRRSAAPQRDVVNSLARHESALIDANTFVYFQDVYDHLSRITDSIDTARDVVNGAMDIYLSSISNRMNDIMKRLTVVATIFMPITFITSFYGMNVRLPFDRHPYAFGLLTLAMLVLTLGMILDFRRRHWW